MTGFSNWHQIPHPLAVGLFIKKLLILSISLPLILINSNAVALEITQERKDKFNVGNFTKFLNKSDNEENLNFLQREIKKYLNPNFNNIEELLEKEAYLTKIIHEDFKRELVLVPVSRDIKKTKRSKSFTVKAYGYKIDLPWEKTKEVYRFKTDFCVLKTGNWLVLFSNPSENFFFPLDFYKDWKSEGHLDLIFYNRPPKSKYEFISAVLNAKESDLTDSYDIEKSLKEKVLLWTLMLLKSRYTKEFDRKGFVDSIYSFNESNVKGFQIGNPITTDIIALILFPNSDVELNVLVFEGENGEVTQDHIDYIIYNFEQIKENNQ